MSCEADQAPTRHPVVKELLIVKREPDLLTYHSMISSSEPPPKRTIEVLRWLCILPAAALGGFVTKQIVGVVSALVAYCWGTPAESDIVYYLRLLLFYPPQELAFVIAGAMTAPRGRFATAVLLAAAGILMSLIIHVLGQRTVGVINYIHFSLESAGAVLGVAYILCSKRM